MAGIPDGATELDFEGALTYHRTWTMDDVRVVKSALARNYRDVVLEWDQYWFNHLQDPDGADFEDTLIETLAWIDVTYNWYVPASGTYVAGHRYKKKDLERVIWDDDWAWNGVNDIYLHAGFIRLRCETVAPMEIELSGRKRPLTSTQGNHTDLYPLCERCWLIHPPEDC